MTLPDTATIFGNHPTRVAEGLWVGRIFVRAGFSDEYLDDGVGCIKPAAGLWLVDLPDCGISIATTTTFDRALLIADEVSRYEPELHECRDAERACRIISRGIDLWVHYAIEAPIEPLNVFEWAARRQYSQRSQQ